MHRLIFPIASIALVAGVPNGMLHEEANKLAPRPRRDEPVHYMKSQAVVRCCPRNHLPHFMPTAHR